ncbi:hypothetical protein B4102_0008 [Heyndrickxia sporothermodurans]|uniref:Uncharacterized protein n=1 Tax=Heyndrickxia sporothermodurans TaxID=46224 RepID=A0A150KKB9_9BACI|nr:hypothetical protein B4102_0008 [Heyndrickxia sporothermodurans]
MKNLSIIVVDSENAVENYPQHILLDLPIQFLKTRRYLNSDYWKKYSAIKS